MPPLRQVFQKLGREKVRPKDKRGGGERGVSKDQRDKPVPTKSDFLATI